MTQRSFLDYGSIGVLLFPVVWLCYSALVVDIDNYDSYDTIHNTLYFTGETSYYLYNRPPFMSQLLIPARMIGKWLNRPPADVKVYHLELAIFHIFYLIFILNFLKKKFGLTGAVLIAFVSAITNFVFFLLTPFLTHDLLPGLFFLLMLILTESYTKEPKFYKFFALILLGGASALTKITFGLFWFAILTATFLLLFSKNQRIKISIFFHLATAAVLSALLYWITMAILLTHRYPSIAFIFRPWIQIKEVYANMPPNAYNPLWLYSYNFCFYGTLTMILIIPGLIMALRKNYFHQLVALSWIISFMLMHCIRFRETRYLAFLMPLSAILIVEPLTELLKKKMFYLPVFLLLSIDIYWGVNEAFAVKDEFYQKSQFKAFTSLLTPETPRFFFLGSMISTIPERVATFTGDIYHRIFHFSFIHVDLLGYERLKPPEDFRHAYASDYPGVILFFTQWILVNPTYFQSPKCPVGLNEYKAYVCKSGKMPVTVQDRKWSFPNKEKLEIQNHPPNELLRIQIPENNPTFNQYLFPCISHTKKKLAYPILKLNNESNAYVILTYHREQFANPEDWEFWGYHIKKMLVSKADRPGTHLLSFEE